MIVDPEFIPYQCSRGVTERWTEPTFVVEAGSGRPTGFLRWPYPMAQVTFSFDVLAKRTDGTDHALILHNFLIARSNVRGWLRWSDLDNKCVHVSDGKGTAIGAMGAVGAAVPVPVTGDGTRGPFQLLSTVGDASIKRYKKVTRPILGGTVIPQLSAVIPSIEVEVAGVVVASANYVITYTNGQILFNAGHEPAPGASLTWSGCKAYPMRLKDPYVDYVMKGPNRNVAGLIAVEVPE